MRLAVLLSGRGSNFAAIHEAIGRGELAAEIAVVVSNVRDAGGVQRAREWGYRVELLPQGEFESRARHEEAVLSVLLAAAVDLVILAGYMRKLSPLFIDAYRNRILNIHPSLLPAFAGVDAQRQALEHGVKIAGCTVHFVDETLDGGPIIVQRAVAVHDSDDVASLSARILEQEHIAYVEAIARVVAGCRVEGRRVVSG